VPYHHVPKHTIHEDLRAIQREGERIIAVTVDADAFHVFTEYTDAPETREHKVDEMVARLRGALS